MLLMGWSKLMRQFQAETAALAENFSSTGGFPYVRRYLFIFVLEFDLLPCIFESTRFKEPESFAVHMSSFRLSVNLVQLDDP